MVLTWDGIPWGRGLVGVCPCEVCHRVGTCPLEGVAARACVRACRMREWLPLLAWARPAAAAPATAAALLVCRRLPRTHSHLTWWCPVNTLLTLASLTPYLFWRISLNTFRYTSAQVSCFFLLYSFDSHKSGTQKFTDLIKNLQLLFPTQPELLLTLPQTLPSSLTWRPIQPHHYRETRLTFLRHLALSRPSASIGTLTTLPLQLPQSLVTTFRKK